MARSVQDGQLKGRIVAPDRHVGKSMQLEWEEWK